jgi:hypothetical protein
MDNKDLQRTIDKIPGLKFKYCGSSPPDFMLLKLPTNTFQIVNTDMGEGEHWVVFINCNNKYWFGDSLGKNVSQYRHLKYNLRKKKRRIYHITKKPVQTSPDACGLFCIYFAYLVLNGLLWKNNNEEDHLLSETFMQRFVNKFIF